MTSETFELILRLVELGDVRVSDHGYDELAADGLSARECIVSVGGGAVVEDYPDYAKGHACCCSRQAAKAGPFTFCGSPQG